MQTHATILSALAALIKMGYTCAMSISLGNSLESSALDKQVDTGGERSGLILGIHLMRTTAYLAQIKR